MCICHNDITKSDLQLFKFTTDTNEAVESIYYREDYDDLSDYEIESPNEEVLQRLARIKSFSNDTDLMREMVGEALQEVLANKNKVNMGVNDEQELKNDQSENNKDEQELKNDESEDNEDVQELNNDKSDDNEDEFELNDGSEGDDSELNSETD